MIKPVARAQFVQKRYYKRTMAHERAPLQASTFPRKLLGGFYSSFSLYFYFFNRGFSSSAVWHDSPESTQLPSGSDPLILRIAESFLLGPHTKKDSRTNRVLFRNEISEHNALETRNHTRENCHSRFVFSADGTHTNATNSFATARWMHVDFYRKIQ